MNAIKRLDQIVSNKIAAGEVVERPLSVVKELVENAIDAGASAVSIDIADGGVGEVCVTDNGAGIPSAQVPLAFEKHATSKISTIKDLDYIGTQGFRGEALSSIAAVSIVDMKTKTRDEETGTHMRISGGRVDTHQPAGLPDGTSITVGNLFFNVPARLKFLKKNAQEAAYVTDLVSRYILAFPEISFHYRSNGKTVYHSPGSGDLKSAIYCIYGSAVTHSMAHVSYALDDIAVDGYVSRPGTTMKNRRAGSVFVNRRYVRSTALHDMVRGAYGQTLVKGEFPFFALNISLPLSAVDVNVHPNKLQVRFKDAAAVEHVIKEAVSAACQNVRGHIEITQDEPTPAPESRVEMRAPEETLAQQDLFTGFRTHVLKEEERIPAPETPETFKTEPAPCTPQPVDVVEPAATPVYTPEYRVIGSFSKAYALVEQGENLLLIDQHAAHERILYDRFTGETSAAVQPLMVPFIITLSHEQKNLIDDHLEAFASLGFDIVPFGMLEYKIGAVPSLFSGADITALLNDALYEIEHHKDDVVLMRETIIRASCRSAVKAGDPLSAPELDALVQTFLQTDTTPTCPHGRPIITVITKKQIEKSFKRVL